MRFIYVILAALLYYFIFFKKWKKNSSRVLLFHSLMYVYGCTVLFLTLLPLPLPLNISFRHEPGFDYGNLIPFNDYLLGRGGSLREIILNVLMMMPFGFLFPIVNRGRRLFGTVFASFLFSLIIEVTQLLMTIFMESIRSFDVTDLITNTTGGFLGYLIFLILKPTIFRMLRIPS